MKKFAFVLLSVVFAGGAFAQSTVKKVKTDIQKEEIKGDIKEKRADQKEVRKEVLHGNMKEAKAKHQDVKADQKELNEDADKAKKNGVAHPKTEAKKELLLKDSK